MSEGEVAYLTMVIVGFVGFAAALAWITQTESRRVG